MRGLSMGTVLNKTDPFQRCRSVCQEPLQDSSIDHIYWSEIWAQVPLIFLQSLISYTVSWITGRTSEPLVSPIVSTERLLWFEEQNFWHGSPMWLHNKSKWGAIKSSWWYQQLIFSGKCLYFWVLTWHNSIILGHVAGAVRLQWSS